MYADIGPSPGAGEGLRCETMLHFQDNKVEYAEIHEPAQSAPNPSQLPGMKSKYMETKEDYEQLNH